ncbi:MAG: 2-oxoglutarate dehydrogenase E1 component [Acidobacteriota bacterium]
MPSTSDPLGGVNLTFVEQLYARYLQDPSSVDGSWQSYFAEMARNDGDLRAARAAVDGPGFAPPRLFDPPSASSPVAQLDLDQLPKLPEKELRQRMDFLQQARLFNTLDAVELELLARLSEDKTYRDQEVLGRQGVGSDGLYVVVDGNLARRRNDETYAFLREGEVVGELAVLDGNPWSADVVAHGDVRILSIGRDRLLSLIDARPALARTLLAILSSRMRQRSSRQDKVNQLIHAYRVRGHLQAALDPLGRERPPVPELSLGTWDLSEEDNDALFSATALGGNRGIMTLRQIVDVLESTYCGAIGVQYMHIDDLAKKRWLSDRLEDTRHHRELSRDEQVRILTKLTDAEAFEQFIHEKFRYAKRFSLEGAETLIPLVDLATVEAARQGVNEVVIGMAHRGRLNVLVNIMGKSPAEVFAEFRDEVPHEHIGRGDVKYHLGYSSDQEFADRQVHLSLCFNPSHLEFVNPVLVGRIRAKQDRAKDSEHRRCLGIAIHGDAAFAGQGVSQELLNMSELHGYKTGGTVHIIVNNQIGFTTAPEEGRSTHYATEVARMLQTPIIHVNGEDPEAVARMVRLAMDYREQFQSDVVIDMYCYRKYGHNEGDEPSFTQPRMYEIIRQRQTVRESYLGKLLQLGEISAEQAEEIRKARHDQLEKELDQAKKPDYKLRGPKSGEGLWSPYRGGVDAETPEVATAVSKEKLAELLRATTRVPEGFNLNSKLKRFAKQRGEMAAGERPLDWGAAEALAFASLSVEGTRIRFSGQDAGRGTFSHRHAVFTDSQSAADYVPLANLMPDQGRFQIYNSPLSEIAVLGFEYGYSLDTPDGLTLWEAQFGDFCNVAQVIIDQFITSGEDKWRRLSGLVMLLPHGFEGQGPEHSSARLERFLNLCAEDNIQVVNLTTPAQIFHCLRRQVLRPLRKPLVVMSPKSLLRLPAATSSLDELATGRFERLIGDTWDEVKPSKVKKVLLTSGKVFFELDAARRENGRTDVALLRLEQYYPLDRALLESKLGEFPDKTPVIWVQEEPRNMGAWSFLQWTFENNLFGRWPMHCVSRPESASPATGSKAAHDHEQAQIIDQALNW